MTLEPPTHTADLTADWMTAALQSRHPGAVVRDVEIVDERGSTNHHVRFRLTYDEPAGGPETVFCKMASLDPVHRAAIGSTGMGAREVRFYNEIADSLEMRTPLCYAASAASDGRFVILLED